MDPRQSSNYDVSSNMKMYGAIDTYDLKCSLQCRSTSLTVTNNANSSHIPYPAK